MVYTAIAYLVLAGAAWLFLRLIQACFWLPKHMKRQNDVQQMLQEKIESYESYIKECDAKEASGEEQIDEDDKRSPEEKRKERQECLDMLKRELKRIQDGGDPYDVDYLLNEEEKRLLEESDKEEDAESEKQREELNATEKPKSGKEQLETKSEPKKTK